MAVTPFSPPYPKTLCYTQPYATHNPMLHTTLCYTQPYATHKLQCPMFHRTGVTANGSIAEMGIFYLFCSCDLDLDQTTFMYELDLYSLEIYQMCDNELHSEVFQKLSYYSLLMHAFSYAWSLPVT